LQKVGLARNPKAEGTKAERSPKSEARKQPGVSSGISGFGVVSVFGLLGSFAMGNNCHQPTLRDALTETSCLI
jgi:hypothetical protein